MDNFSLNNANKFCNLLFDKKSIPLTTDNFVLLLSDKETYANIYKASAWLVEGNYIQNIFSEIISRFVKEHPTLVNAYLKQKYSLTEICQTLAQFIFINKFIFCKDKILTCLAYGNKAVDRYVFNSINNHLQQPREVINLLGFGSNQGFYENFIANYILNKQLAKHVRVYGFDPYSSTFGKNIIPIKLTDLEGQQNLQFDIVIARWVLHHINYSERWHTFIKCTNAFTNNGLLLILDEGSFAEDKQDLKELMYRFYLGCVDVVINFGLRPEWFLATTSQIGANFFVDYLTQADLQTLESNFKVNYKRYYSSIHDPKFFSQSIISYNMSYSQN